jgi:hypothetical protein
MLQVFGVYGLYILVSTTEKMKGGWERMGILG